jgi:sodium-dependent dicarboxylate transporter 2/3/5
LRKKVAGTSADEREAQFERLRRTAGLWLGPAVFGLCWVLPVPSLTGEAHRLLAVVSWVVTWWITEAIPLPATALWGAALCVVCGVAGATEVFTPFASPTIFLFVGSFMLGRAISVHQLDRRIALSLLSLPLVQGSLNRIRLAMLLLCMALSAWLSNTATAAMMLPVTIGVLGAAGLTQPRGSRSFSAGFLLTIAYATTAGGIITPIGTPPNLITLGLLDELAGVKINFLTWIMFMTPIALACGVAIFVIGARSFPATDGDVNGARHYLDRVEHQLEPWTAGQRNCLAAFVLAVTLWITPGVLAACGLGEQPWVRTLTERLDEAVVAVLAASLLFFLPINWRERRFTLGWSEAVQIDWGTILLFGGGLSLGRLMFVTGLAEHIGHAIVTALGVETLWSVTALAAALGILLTEITSNTAATNMLVPVVISIAQANGISPLVPALAACLGANMAFMLPISTPPNALVYSSGHVPVTAMLRFGIVLDVLAFVIILAGLRILAPAFGWV